MRATTSAEAGHDAAVAAPAGALRAAEARRRLAHAFARPAVRWAAAFAFYLLATLVWLAPLVGHLDGRVFGAPGDGTSTIRDFWAQERQGATPFDWNHDTMISAPEGIPRSPQVAVQNGLYQLGIWIPGKLIGWNAAYNLFILSSFVLAGFCMFLLLDRLGCRSLPALFGGYVYAFSPEHFWIASAGHAGRAQNAILPLLVLALVNLRWRQSAGAAVLVGAATATAFYLDAYLGLFAVVLAAVFAVVDIVRTAGRRWSLSLLYDVALLSTAAFLIPTFLAWLASPERLATSLNRTGADIEVLGARLVAYVIPAEGHPLFGSWVRSYYEANPAARNFDESALFFGYTTMILAAIAVYLTFRRHRRLVSDSRFLVIVVSTVLVLALALSLSRPVRVLGIELPTAAGLVSEFTSYYRAYARFGVLVGLALVVLAALGLNELMRRSRGSTLAVGAFALVAFELAVGPPVEIWRTDQPPPEVTWLARHPGGTVANYPLYENYGLLNGTPLADTQSEHYIHQVVHGHARFEGARQDKNPVALRRRELARDPSTRRGRAVLAASGVRYLVIRDDLYASLGLPAPLLGDHYRLQARFGRARVYELFDPAGRFGPPAVALRDRGFHAPELQPNGDHWRWMRGVGTLLVYSRAPTARVRLAFVGYSRRRDRLLEVLGPRGRVLGAASLDWNPRLVTFGPIRLARGVTRLRLVASPGPARLSTEDRRHGSVFLSPVEVESAGRG